jgi:hypothetical protein
MDDEDVERVGGWLTSPFCMDPIDLFLFANRQSSLADRLDGLLHSGRPLNRMGLVEFIPFQVK